MHLLAEWVVLFFCILGIGLTFAIFKLLKFTEPMSREEPSIDDSIVREDLRGNRKDICFQGAVVLTYIHLEL